MRSTSTPGSSRASAAAMAGVASVLALSAMTIRQENGSSAPKIAVQAAHAALERGLLVENGHDDLDARRSRGRGPPSACATGGLESVCSVMVTASARAVGPPWELPESPLRVERRSSPLQRGQDRRSAPQRGGRQRDDEGGAAVRGVAGAHVAAVGVDDGRDDRQAQARRRRGRARGRPPSARSARTALRRRWWAARGRGRGPPGAPRRRRCSSVTSIERALRRVDERVAQQVAEHLAQLVAVADDQRRAVDPGADLAARAPRRARRRRRRGRSRRGRARRAATSGTSSRRARVRRSSTSTPIRAASSSMRRIAFSTSAGSRAAPMRKSSA